MKKGENFRNVLQTDIVVNIDNYLFGERDDNQAIVRIDKGEDENTIVSSDGYPDFEVNEKFYYSFQEMTATLQPMKTIMF